MTTNKHALNGEKSYSDGLHITRECCRVLRKGSHNQIFSNFAEMLRNQTSVLQNVQCTRPLFHVKVLNRKWSPNIEPETT